MSVARLGRRAAVRSFFYEGSDFGVLQQHVWAVILGLLTGLLAAGYSMLLDLSLDALWKQFPEVLSSRAALGPAYTLAVVGTGAVLVAGMGAVLPTPGGMDEWIDMLHTTGSYPSARLAPVVVLSFITAATGFSVGPEAPMVVVGAICGSLVARAFKQSVAATRVMNLAGAAGCLSAFFGRPLVGAFFVLEFPHRLGVQYYEALSPAIIASVVSALVARCVHWTPFGGSYNYGVAQGTLPPTIVWLPLTVALVVSCLAVLSVLLMHLFKRAALGAKEGIRHCTGREWPGPLLVRLAAGTLIGLLGMAYPQTLFWGETNLQTALDGQQTPLHLIGNTTLERWALVGAGPGLGGWGALQVALAKVLAIALAAAGGFPGGIIYPFFFAGAYFGTALCSVGSVFADHGALTIICSMAVLQAVITKTPLASMLIVMVTASSFEMAGTVSGEQALGAMLPLLVCAMHFGLLLVHPTGVSYLQSARDRSPEGAAARAAERAELKSEDEGGDGGSSASGGGSSSSGSESSDRQGAESTDDEGPGAGGRGDSARDAGVERLEEGHGAAAPRAASSPMAV
mmetsp:Transcript_80547/g.249930  ORF Transcript_80547/g.249930 Transcript_80547/m.249930 type:complete len:570 (+) Transcript_80547:64-1773(+)